ncbi:MAG: hypothetical protein WCB27_17015 [Thermoguttaceae bacterium]|jgi:hypothetical protein
MVATLEENKRGQVSGTTYERETQPFQPATESVTEQYAPQATTLPAGREHLLPLSLIVSDATVGVIGGIATLILTIIGLSGLVPAYLLGVSCIVVGATFLMLAASGITWARMFRFGQRQETWNQILLRMGVFAAIAAGFAGITLGILNLVFPALVSLTAISVIALGAGLIWHSTVMANVGRFTRDSVAEHRGSFGGTALSLAPVREFLVGTGAVVLGILALLGIVPVTLTLVGLLMLGAALIFSHLTVCGATLATLKGCSKTSCN